MALNVETPLVRYAGSGTRGPFSVAVASVPITFLNKSEIVVTRWSALGVPTVYVESTHYTLSAESVVTGEAAASVTLAMSVTVLGDGEKLQIERQTPRSQIQQFTQGGGFSSASTERTLDRKTRIIQEIDYKVGRALGLHPLTTGSPPTLPQTWVADSLLGSDASNALKWYTAADFVGATGPTGATGATGAAGTNGTNGTNGATPALTFTYSTTTTDSDPGAGVFRLNHATIANATAAYIDNVESGGVSVATYLDTLDDPTSTIKGTLFLRGLATPTAFALFHITGSVVDGTGYRKLTLTHLHSGGVWANGETFALCFLRTGDKGDTGAGTGDLLAANNLNDVADKPTARTNLAVFGIGNNLSEGTPSTMRANLGLVIGTNVQAHSAKLDALAAQTWAADKLTYQTSSSAVSTTDLTAAARALLAGASATAILALLIPPGFIADWAGTSAPTGWLLCYGQAISRTTYSALYAQIGTTHGVGDGSTTFNVPDYRGRVSAGKDDMGGSAASRLTNSGTGNPGIDGSTLGAAGGSDRHTLTSAQMPTHAHNERIYSGGAGSAFVPDGVAGRSSGDAGYTTENAGSSEAHPIVQPTIVMNKIIFAGV